MDGKKQLGIIIGGFIAILLGIILVDVIADNIEASRSLSNIDNETITISSTDNTATNESILISTSGKGQTHNASVVGVTFFGNATNSTHLTDVVQGVEVNYTASGGIIVATDVFSNGTYNISYTYSTAGTGELGQDDVTAISYFGNGNTSTAVSGLEIGDEVNVTKATGVLSVSTLNFTDGDYNVSYTYEGSLYVASSTSRTLLGLIVIFFVIGIVAIAVNLFKKMDIF